MPLQLQNLGDVLYMGSVVFGLDEHPHFFFLSLTSVGIPKFIVYFLGKVTRNLYFHPLSKYPGPKLFAATSLVNTYYLLQGNRVYKAAELHNKFGPIVRIAPNELSYVDVDAWKGIYAAHKDGQLKKHQAPDPMNANHLFSCPTDEGHSFLRKKISPVFSEKNVRDREGVLQHFADSLVAQLKKTRGTPKDLVFWFECATLDITGRLGFGESFKCLETATLHPVMTTAMGIFKIATILNDLVCYPVVPWVLLGLSKLVDNPFTDGLIGKTILERLEQRKAAMENQEDEDLPAFVSYLMKGQGTPKEVPWSQIRGTASDLLVAGSDTVATVLSATTWLLLQHPTALQHLRSELRSTFASSSDISLSAALHLKYLNAVILESMRLFPAAPETFRRTTNRNGNLICGDVIPHGTVVGVYHWAAGHNAASWRDVEAFVPERWLGDERYKDDNKGVLQFFNAGPRNCVGQNLANAEMHLILAKIFWEFNMELMPESKNWKDMKSWGLIYDKRPLMVKMNPAVGNGEI